MDTHTPHPTGTADSSRYLLFIGIALVAIVSVVLAVILPRQRADLRRNAATAVACAGSVTVPPSTCNGKCGDDQDCTGGMICYKTTGQVDGVCRNPAVPESPNCTTPPPATRPPTAPPSTPVVTVPPTTPPTAPPTTAACTKTCTYSYECSAGQYCKGTNANNTASVVETSKRAATATELSALKADQKIAGVTEQPDANGKIKYTVISKVDTTYTAYLFVIMGTTKDSLNPQYKVISKTFPIAANTIVQGVITQPACGRFQVDLGSPTVVGTSYQLNSLADYFWGAVYNTPCQSGCCVAQ